MKGFTANDIGNWNSNSNASQVNCSGTIFYSATTDRVLLIQKATGRHKGYWGLVGGTNLEDENPLQGLLREVEEEIGFIPKCESIMALETFNSNDSAFTFYTYLCMVDVEFIPILSQEHIAWGWFSLTQLPKPVHRGLKISLNTAGFREKIEEVINGNDRH